MIVRDRIFPFMLSTDVASFGAVFRHPSAPLLCLMYVANTYGFYFLITWLPTYLEKVRGFAKAELAIFAGLPLMLSVFADIFGGLATDWLTGDSAQGLGAAPSGLRDTRWRPSRWLSQRDPTRRAPRLF